MNRILGNILALLFLAVFAVSCDDEYEDTKDAGNAYIASIDEDGVVTLNTGLKYKKYFEEDPSWPSVPALPTYIYMNYTVMFINGDTLVSDSMRNVTYITYDSLIYKVSDDNVNWRDTAVYVKNTGYMHYKIYDQSSGTTVDSAAYVSSLPTSFDGLSLEIDTINPRDTTVLYKPVFSYSNMLEGCRQAIKRMKVGSKWRLWIPYNLAYGSDGVNSNGIKVDPYTALIYDIELIGVSAN